MIGFVTFSKPGHFVKQFFIREVKMFTMDTDNRSQQPSNGSATYVMSHHFQAKQVNKW